MPYIKTAGTYNATCILPKTAEQLFTTSSTGKDGIALDFVTEEGLEISTVLWLSPAAYERTLKVLTEVFKFDGNFNALAKGEGFPNYECKIVVEMEDYQAKDGTTKQGAKVKWINSRGPTRKPADVRGVMSRLSQITGQTPPPDTRDISGSAADFNEGGAFDMEADEVPFRQPHYFTVGGW